MKYNLITSETWYPVSLYEARQHLNIIADDDDTHPDDELIISLIKMASEQFEHDTGKCLVKSSWYGYLNTWPNTEILVTKTPVTEITSVEYIAANASEYTPWNQSLYITDMYANPPRIRPAKNTNWPNIENVYNAVRVKFTAGYNTPVDIPCLFKAAIKLKLAHLYANRQEVTSGNVYEVPQTYNNIIDKIRLTRFA